MKDFLRKRLAAFRYAVFFNAANFAADIALQIKWRNLNAVDFSIFFGRLKLNPELRKL